MASSSTAIPDRHPDTDGSGEQEPLLGRAGDASQREGTAGIAQAGIWILTAMVWASVFMNPLILFSAHPLLNSAGLLLVTQGIIILQPTHTAQQKQSGTKVHSILNGFGVDALIAGLVVIEINKVRNNIDHFESPHAILGILSYILLFIQSFVGLTQFYFPALYGGVNNAKKLYKYHRASGYVILILMLATVAAATQTPFNVNALHIKLWAVIVMSLLVLVGIIPRIKKQKLGF
ncbi:MAG: hypothetical protein M1825_006090 [Sarcosagium campestre]|nr:MAG: hypothetical protein M1825_006090 [Sarcosagium campestre]